MEAYQNSSFKMRHTPTEKLADELIQIRLNRNRPPYKGKYGLEEKFRKRQERIWREILRRHDEAVLKGKEHLLGGWPTPPGKRIPKKEL